jgi:hypothetical protein
MGFGHTKKKIGFIVKLCLIWYIMSNVQGIIVLKKKKFMYKANGGFWVSWEFEFFFFAIPLMIGDMINAL